MENRNTDTTPRKRGGWTKRPYTAEECETIRSHYGTHSAEEIAEMLGRSRNSVANKCTDLGLAKNSRRAGSRADTWRRNLESWKGTPFRIPPATEGRGRDVDAAPMPRVPR